MEKIIWYSPDVKKPNDNQVVAFKPTTELDEQDVTYEGIFIESEDMFFIGFEETGDFIHSQFCAFWKPLNKVFVDPLKVVE